MKKKRNFVQVLERYEDEMSVTIQAYKKCCTCGVMKKDTASKKNKIILKNNPLPMVSTKRKSTKNGKIR